MKQPRIVALSVINQWLIMFLPSKHTDKADASLVSMLQIYAIFFETTRALLRFLYYQLIDSLVKVVERK